MKPKKHIKQGLYRSTVEDRVHKIAGNYGNDTHETFLRLIFYLVTGFGYDDLEPEDITDGHGEYQSTHFTLIPAASRTLPLLLFYRSLSRNPLGQQN